MATAHQYEVINLGVWPTVRSDIPTSVRMSIAGQLGSDPRILLPGHILMTKTIAHRDIVSGWIERIHTAFGRGEHPVLHLELQERGRSAGTRY